MGTHPIFESDFDCLTECQDTVDIMVVAVMGVAVAMAAVMVVIMVADIMADIEMVDVEEDMDTTKMMLVPNIWLLSLVPKRTRLIVRSISKLGLAIMVTNVPDYTIDQLIHKLFLSTTCIALLSWSTMLKPRSRRVCFKSITMTFTKKFFMKSNPNMEKLKK